MTRALPVDPLKVSDYRQGIENRLAAFETTHFQPAVPGYLLPTDQITGFDPSNFSVFTQSKTYVPVYQGRVEQMVRPAILIGFRATYSPVTISCYATPAGATGQFRLRLQNAAGVDVGNSPSSVNTLGFYTDDYLFYWNHGVQLWTNETFTLSVEARVTSVPAGDSAVICQPLAGFEQTGLTLAGRTVWQKEATYIALGRPLYSISTTPRATTNGLGTF
jgi:hypothetical protein